MKGVATCNPFRSETKLQVTESVCCHRLLYKGVPHRKDCHSGSLGVLQRLLEVGIEGLLCTPGHWGWLSSFIDPFKWHCAHHGLFFLNLNPCTLAGYVWVSSSFYTSGTCLLYSVALPSFLLSMTCIRKCPVPCVLATGLCHFGPHF